MQDYESTKQALEKERDALEMKLELARLEQQIAVLRRSIRTLRQRDPYTIGDTFPGLYDVTCNISNLGYINSK